jgi:hypothetical protein
MKSPAARRRKPSSNQKASLSTSHALGVFTRAATFGGTLLAIRFIAMAFPQASGATGIWRSILDSPLLAWEMAIAGTMTAAYAYRENRKWAVAGILVWAALLNLGGADLWQRLGVHFVQNPSHQLESPLQEARQNRSAFASVTLDFYTHLGVNFPNAQVNFQDATKLLVNPWIAKKVGNVVLNMGSEYASKLTEDQSAALKRLPHRAFEAGPQDPVVYFFDQQADPMFPAFNVYELGKEVFVLNSSLLATLR